MALFRGGRHRIEADVCKKHDGSAGQHPGIAIRHEWVPVRRIDCAGRAQDEYQDGDYLDDDDNVVSLGALAHAAHQQIAERQQDQQSRNIEPASCKLAFDDHGPRELGRQVNAKKVLQNIAEVCRKAHRDTHVGERVLED